VVDVHDNAHDAPGGRWGGFELLSGAEATVVGWLAHWSVFAALGGMAVETAFIEWGAGTWPDPNMPWISVDVMHLALFVMLVDVIAVALHNTLLNRRARRRE
jgi:hypothetical protein